MSSRGDSRGRTVADLRHGARASLPDALSSDPRREDAPTGSGARRIEIRVRFDPETVHLYFRKVRSGTTLPSVCSAIDDGTHFQPVGAQAMATRDPRRARESAQGPARQRLPQRPRLVRAGLQSDRDARGQAQGGFQVRGPERRHGRVGQSARPSSRTQLRDHGDLPVDHLRRAVLGARRRHRDALRRHSRMLRIDASWTRTLRVRVLAPDGRSLRTARFESSEGLVSLPLADAPRGPLSVRCVAGRRPVTEIVIAE